MRLIKITPIDWGRNGIDRADDSLVSRFASLIAFFFIALLVSVTTSRANYLFGLIPFAAFTQGRFCASRCQNDNGRERGSLRHASCPPWRESAFAIRKRSLK